MPTTVLFVNRAPHPVRVLHLDAVGREVPAFSLRVGEHTEHLGYVLAEMQHLQRAYPGARW